MLTEFLCFQSVAVDMPVDEEDSLETIEQLRNRYETLSLLRVFNI